MSKQIQHEKTFFLESSSSGFGVFSPAYTISYSNNNNRTIGIQNRNENTEIHSISGVPKVLQEYSTIAKNITKLR